jgi:hypothetical protein
MSGSYFAAMQGVEVPPDCAICGSRVGLWEKIVVIEEHTDEIATSWLALARSQRSMPDAVAHLLCFWEAPESAEATS